MDQAPRFAQINDAHALPAFRRRCPPQPRCPGLIQRRAVVFQPVARHEPLSARLGQRAALHGHHPNQRPAIGNQHIRAARLRPARQRQHHHHNPGPPRLALPQPQHQRARRQHRYHPARRAGHRATRALQPGNKFRHAQYPAQPQRHRHKPDLLQPQRRQQPRRHGRGHHHHAHDRHRHQVGRQAIMRHLVEERRRKGRRGQPGHQRRDEHRRHRPHPAWPQRDLAVTQPSKTDHQRRCRGKGHLKTRPQKRLGPQHQNHQRRHRHRPQAQRPAIEQDRHQHHRCHHECPLGRHAAPRQHQISRRSHKRRHRRHFARGDPQRHRRHQRQPHPHSAKHEPGQQPHVQTGNRQQMRQVRYPQRIDGRQRNAGPVPGCHGRAEPGHIGGHPRLDRPRQPHAKGKHVPPPGGRPQFQHGAAGIAHRAQPLKPGMTPEIEAAGLHRPVRGRQVAAQPHPQSRRRIDIALGSVQRHPHPARRVGGGNALEHHIGQGQAHRVRGRPVYPHHGAFDRPVIAPGQNRPGHRMRPRPGQRKPRHQQRQRPKQRTRDRAAAQRSGAKAHRADTRAPQRRNRRFAPQQEIQTDPYPKENRCPGKQMPPLPQQGQPDLVDGAQALSSLGRVDRQAPTLDHAWLPKG